MLAHGSISNGRTSSWNNQYTSYPTATCPVVVPFGLSPAAYRSWIDNYENNLTSQAIAKWSLTARFMGPTWGPSGAGGTQVDSLLATWTLLPGVISHTARTDDNTGHDRFAVDFMTFPSVICMYSQLLKYTMDYHSNSNEWEGVRVRVRKRDGWDKDLYVDIYLSMGGC